MSAIVLNNLEVIKIFIRKKISIDIPAAEGRTPLMFAALMGNVAAVKLHLENGAKLEAQDEHGKTADAYLTEMPLNPLQTHFWNQLDGVGSKKITWQKMLRHLRAIRRNIGL